MIFEVFFSEKTSLLWVLWDFFSSESLIQKSSTKDFGNHTNDMARLYAYPYICSLYFIQSW